MTPPFWGRLQSGPGIVMIIRKIQGRGAAFLTRRDLLRLSLACVVVLLVATTWRQTKVDAAFGDEQNGAAGYDQIISAPETWHGQDIGAFL